MVAMRPFLNSVAFNGLSERQLDEIGRMAESAAYQPGEAVFEEGAPAQRLYVVEEGKVALEMNLPAGSRNAPRRVTVEIITKGEPMGWSSLVGTHVFTLSAICLDHVRLTIIDADKLRSLLDRDPQVGYKVMKNLIGVVSSRLELTRHVLTSERGA